MTVIQRELSHTPFVMSKQEAMNCLSLGIFTPSECLDTAPRAQMCSVETNCLFTLLYIPIGVPHI